MAVPEARSNAIRLTRERQRAQRAVVGYPDAWMTGSKPTVCSNDSITGATKSFCLKYDEFHLLVVNLLCHHCRKDFSTIFILKYTNRRARDIVAI
jgi:hypothetical protein